MLGREEEDGRRSKRVGIVAFQPRLRGLVYNILLYQLSTPKMDFYRVLQPPKLIVYYINQVTNCPQSSNLFYLVFDSAPISNQRETWTFQNPPLPQVTGPTQEAEAEENPLQSPQHSSTEKPVRKARKQCPLKEKESAKKNSESNLVNQFLAFMSSQQVSEKLVLKAIKIVKEGVCQEQKIKSIFYNIVRLMNFKRGRRYVNRQTLLKFYTPSSFQKEFPDIQQKCAETGVITLEEICHLFRIVSFEFVKNYSTIAVLTSKRVSMIAKPDHLERRRKLEHSLLNDIDFME